MSKRKAKRLKRSFPKRFAADNIQTSRRPSKAHIPESAEGIADYRQRGKSLDFSTFSDYKYTKEEIAKRNAEPLIPKMPETGYQILEAEDQSPPRFRVLELLENRLLNSHGFNDFKYYTVLYQHGNTTLKLFHSGLKRCFVKEIGDVAVRSIIYDTKEEADRALHSKKGIFWLKIL